MQPLLRPPDARTFVFYSLHWPILFGLCLLQGPRGRLSFIHANLYTLKLLIELQMTASSTVGVGQLDCVSSSMGMITELGWRCVTQQV